MQGERWWVFFSDQSAVKKVITLFISPPFRKSFWGTSMTVKGFIHSAAGGALTLIRLRRLWSVHVGSTKLHFSDSKLAQNVLCDTVAQNRIKTGMWPTYVPSNTRTEILPWWLNLTETIKEQKTNRKQRVWWKCVILSLSALWSSFNCRVCLPAKNGSDAENNTSTWTVPEKTSRRISEQRFCSADDQHVCCLCFI